MKKLLVVGVIVLFLGLAVAPSINANISKEGELVDITVSNYKEDGKVEKSTVKLSKVKALELATRIKRTNNPEERFSLYQEYEIIPEDVTDEQLKQRMLSNAERLGFTQEKIESICNNPMFNRTRFFRINFQNKILGLCIINLNLPIGTSLITGTINYELKAQGKKLLNSTDLLYLAFTPVGFYRFSQGVLPDVYLFPIGGIILIGFVGYVISYPFLGLAVEMYGFSVISSAIGFIFMEPPW